MWPRAFRGGEPRYGGLSNVFCVSRVPGLGFVVNQSRYGVWDFFGCFFLMLIGSREFEICAFGTCDSIELSKFCLRGM